MIEACIYGSREIYPGQTVTLQLLVQNSGYVESYYGYHTPDVLSQSGSASLTASGNSLSQKTVFDSSDYQINAAGLGAGTGSGTGAGAITGSASASSTSGSSSISSSSYSFYRSGYAGDLEINSGADVTLAATTALGISCRLDPGNAPVEIISDELMLLGSLVTGTTSAPVPYLIRVSRDAEPGHYLLPMTITYKRLAEDLDYTSLFGSMYGYNCYIEETCVVNLEIVIMEIFDLVVSDVTVTDMVPGTNGIVSIKVANLGDIPTEDTIVYIQCSSIGPAQDSYYYPLDYQLMNYQTISAQQPKPIAQNMLIPTQNSQYLGHMEPGEERIVKFKMSVSEDAEEGDFPVSAVVSYNDPWGVQKSSNVRTFGAHVEPEMRFVTDDSLIEIKCGRSGISNITLENEGSQVARSAIVRMNALDPFTVSYDTMYLGDVAPGENVTTRYGIKVKPDAVPGTYYVTLEVKYYDRQDDPHVTKVIRKPVTVLPPPGWWDLIMENLPLVIGLLLIAAAGAGYLIYKRMKGRKNSPSSAPDKPEESPERKDDEQA